MLKESRGVAEVNGELGTFSISVVSLVILCGLGPKTHSQYKANRPDRNNLEF